jgi:hypothetical protein
VAALLFQGDKAMAFSCNNIIDKLLYLKAPLPLENLSASADSDPIA